MRSNLFTHEIIQDAGRSMVLKRRIGVTQNFVSKTVKGFSVNFKPEELLGGVVQGDRRIRISYIDVGDIFANPPTGISPQQWANKIRAGDFLDEAVVMGAELKYSGETPMIWVVWVRG
jgi:hypothetical protein